MAEFINKNLSLKTRKRIYRFVLTLSEIDFSFLLPVSFGSIAFFLAYFGLSASEAARASLTKGTMLAYFIVLAANTILFVITLMPLCRKLRAKFRVYLYRRKKRAYTGFSFR